MRLPASLLLVALVPAVSFAQTKEIDDAVKAKLAAIRYVQQLQSPSGGFQALTSARVSSPARAKRAAGSFASVR